MDSAFAAARLGDPIAHSSAMMGFLVGALVGAVVGVAIVAATVATGGAALAVVAAVGGAVAATGGGALAGMSIGQEYTTVTGAISTGAFTVFINNRPAARATSAPATMDVAACSDHQSPQFLAEGSRTVFIEMGAASRKGDRTVCDAKISEGSPNVFIGADPGQYRAISPEVPQVLQQIAQGMVIVGTAVALLAGGAAAFIGGASACGTTLGGFMALGRFGLTAGLGAAGGWGGTKLGGTIGEVLGGAKGRAWGEAIGGFAGGMAGGYAGNKLGPRVFRADPIDVATGELASNETDFELPGPLPLTWSRLWISSSTIDGELGRGWHNSLDMALILPGGGRSLFTLRHDDGRYVLFEPPRPGHPSLNTAERLILHTEGDRFWVTDYSGLRFDFATGAVVGLRHLVGIADPNGNAIVVDRGPDGRLQRIVDSGGRTLDVATDAAGRILAIDGQAPSGDGKLRLVAYRYDASGHLLEVRRAGGAVFSYEYQGDLMVRRVRPGGLAFHFEWDDPARGKAARCVNTWGDGGYFRCRFAYDEANRRTTVRDGRGGVTEYHWNELGLVTLEIDTCGGRIVRDYDGAGRVVLAINPIGGRSGWAYDDLGRPAQIVDPIGGVIRLRYAADGREALTLPCLDEPIEVEEPGGRRHQFEYDARGNLARYVDPAGREQRYVRDLRGLPIAVLDAEGIRSRFGWTTAGNLAWEATERGVCRRFDHDALGRLVAGQIVGEAPIRLMRDDAGRVIRIDRPDGARTVLAYDPEGRVTLHRDAAGRETAWAYDGLPYPVRRSNPDGSVLSYRYDSELNLIGLINPKGEHYVFDYDLAGRRVREVGFDGREQRYIYDMAGRLLRHDDAGGRVTEYRRDPLGRLLEKRFADGTVHRFDYDPAGRLSQAINPTRSVRFVYDAAGDLLEEHQDQHVLRHRYDGRRRRVATVLPDGREIAIGYDDTDEFADIGFAGRAVARVERNDAGREVARQTGALQSVSEYDPQGRLARRSAWAEGKPADPVLGRWYRYDPADLIVSIGDWHRGVRNYRYDACERLLQVTGDRPEDFVVDPAGNILASGEAADVLGGAARGDRLLVHGDRHFEYDASGNRIREARGARQGVEVLYGYGPDNQLASVIEVSRLGRRETKFGYDALGRRVWKETRAWGPPAANLAETPVPLLAEARTEFLWTGDLLLAEGSGRPGAAVSDPLAVVYLFEPRSFRPLAQIRRAEPNGEGQVFHYHCDVVGTPQEVTNDDGAIVWQGELKAWGGVAATRIALVPNPLRFQGQYHDVETNLHYNRFRYFAPDEGCFIGPDPIGLMGGENLYRFAPNPIMWVDPLGLSCHWDRNVNRWRDSQTGRFAARPTDPSQMVRNGRMNYADVQAWSAQGQPQPGGLPNMWQPNPQQFPTGGFRYQEGPYRMWGHGINPNAVQNYPGSNAATGPTVSIRGPGGNYLAGPPPGGTLPPGAGGRWGPFASDPNAAHIPLDNSPF
ncbi:RHS domain-containing protein [Inquilinus limosus]|uniref:RHS repeat-associated core domain-containing protein n=1 Tax=Inquilinus limosus TaxID=171674 RepID=UPI003F17CAC2